MAVVDEKVMEEEVTDEQFEDAKHLPFRQLAVCVPTLQRALNWKCDWLFQYVGVTEGSGD
jgi:hypothetical protein